MNRYRFFWGNDAITFTRDEIATVTIEDGWLCLYFNTNEYGNYTVLKFDGYAHEVRKAFNDIWNWIEEEEENED
jgi:hypothetical protein